MAKIRVVIHYVDLEGFVKAHTREAESVFDNFMEDVRDTTETVTKDGFFLVMEEKRYVFIPPTQIVQMEWDFIDSEDGS